MCSLQYEETPLFYAGRKGHEHMLRLLLQVRVEGGVCVFVDGDRLLYSKYFLHLH